MSIVLNSRLLIAFTGTFYLLLFSVAHAGIPVLSEEWESNSPADSQYAEISAIAAISVLVIAVGVFFVIKWIRKNKQDTNHKDQRQQNETLSTQNSEHYEK